MPAFDQKAFNEKERAAEWGRTFMPDPQDQSPTSLARRNRYQQDIERFEQAQPEAIAHQQDLMEADLLERAQNDRGAQALYFRTKSLQAQQERDRRKLEWDDINHPLQEQAASLRIEKANADRASALRRETRDLETSMAVSKYRDDVDDYNRKNPLATDEQKNKFKESLIAGNSDALVDPAIKADFVAWQQVKSQQARFQQSDAAREDTQAHQEKMATDRNKVSSERSDKQTAASKDTAESRRINGLKEKRAEAVASKAKATADGDTNLADATQIFIDGLNKLIGPDEGEPIRGTVESPADGIPGVDIASKSDGANTEAPKNTVWKADKNGVKWEYNADTKQPTGTYVKPN